MFCCEFWEIFKNTFFREHLWTTGSAFLKAAFFNLIVLNIKSKVNQSLESTLENFKIHPATRRFNSECDTSGIFTFKPHTTDEARKKENKVSPNLIYSENKQITQHCLLNMLEI